MISIFQSNTNNLYIVVWFYVFLSNTWNHVIVYKSITIYIQIIYLHTIILFQVTSNNNPK